MTNPNLKNITSELLEALEELLEDYVDGAGLYDVPGFILEEDPLVKKCRAAIAKAKGERV